MTISDLVKNIKRDYVGNHVKISQNSQGSSFDELVQKVRNSPLPKAMQDDLIQAHAQVRKNRIYLHEVVDADGNITKKDNGDRANQTSLIANGDAGTQSLLSADNVTQTEEKSNDYMDALADDRNVPKAQQENRPTMACKDLRTDVLNLFSVPAGSRKALGEAIDRAGAEMLRTGGVTEENRAKLMDALYDAGVTVRDADPAYKAVRDDLRGRKIYVDEYRHGRIWVTTGGVWWAAHWVTASH